MWDRLDENAKHYKKKKTIKKNIFLLVKKIK